MTRRDDPAGLLPDSEQTVHLSIRIPVRVSNWLRERARVVGVGVSAVARDALEAQLLLELESEGTSDDR